MVSGAHAASQPSMIIGIPTVIGWPSTPMACSISLASAKASGEIIHLFMTDDPEQVRGVPWMHAVMLSVNDLKGYNHAAIVAARIGASKMGFFTSPDGDPTPVSDGEDGAGMPFSEADPGQFGMLLRWRLWCTRWATP